MLFDPRLLGPLAPLAGIWEGDKGDDIAPADDRGIETNKYRERITFSPFGPVNNHEQTLYGLKYATVAFRIGEDEAFHEEIGYWLWDEIDSELLRCFMVPRGISVIAGGKVSHNAKSFQLIAERGSPTHGILSSSFLEREFKTIRYELKITVHGEDSFSYEEDTQLLIKDRPLVFHHRDKNTLSRVTE